MTHEGGYLENLAHEVSDALHLAANLNGVLTLGLKIHEPGSVEHELLKLIGALGHHDQVVVDATVVTHIRQSFLKELQCF